MPPAKGWRDINMMTIAFGHGISVTPLHVVTGISAIANGGILRQPTLLAQPPGDAARGHARDRRAHVGHACAG